MKIKKGDKVKVMTGASRGTVGTVIKVYPADCRIVVEGVNMLKRHQRSKRGGQKGSIVEKPHPIHASNVARVTK